MEPSRGELASSLGATPQDGWTRAAFNAKIKNLGVVLRHATGGPAPGLLGLCEVQNSRASSKVVAAAGWQGQLTEATADPQSPSDHDLALYYSPQLFKQVGVGIAHNVHQRFATRDVFEVELEVRASGERFAVLTHHWPSRTVSGSEALRIALADHTDRLVRDRVKFGIMDLRDRAGRPRMRGRTELKARWDYPVVMVGDLNDEPWDVSIRRFLSADASSRRVVSSPSFPRGSGLSAVEAYLQKRPRLYNASWELVASSPESHGTAFWNGQPYLLDQLLLTRGAVTGPVRYEPGSLRIVNDATAGSGASEVSMRTRAGRPRKFNVGSLSGASDHFPLIWQLNI